MSDDRIEGRRAGGLRVALVAFHFAEYSLLMAKALAQYHRVLLVLDRANATAELTSLPDPEDSNLEIVAMGRPTSLIGAVAGANELVRVVTGFRPDVVHCQEAVSNPLLLAMRRLRAFPMVVSVHDPRPHSGDEARSLSSIKRLLVLRRWRSICDVALTHGEALVADVVRLYPRLEGRVLSVPHGPLGGPPATVEPEPGCLLFFGRIHKYKGLGDFVEAVLRLHAGGVPVRGVIAGRGPDLAPYRSRIDGHPAFELHDRFICQDELPGLFGRAQAVVLPYTDGTQSGVAALALGFGRPVVSTRVGAVQEMVRDGDNGLLVPPRDVDALVQALAALIADPGRALRMGQRSLALGRGELSWDRNARISTQAYHMALQRCGRSTALNAGVAR